MLPVFVDSAAWLALDNKKDQLHDQAQQVKRKLEQQNALLVTTEFVLLEVADGLCTAQHRRRAVGFIDGLRQLPILRIVPASQTLLGDGWTLYRQRPDKDWSLTDCTSFVVMAEQRFVQAFTSDHHFEQAGFQRLIVPA